MAPESLYVSAITILELEIGVLRIERRDRRQGTILRAWLDRAVLPAFDGRTLPVDREVAIRCASLHVPGQRSDRDALIAAFPSSELPFNLRRFCSPVHSAPPLHVP